VGPPGRAGCPGVGPAPPGWLWQAPWLCHPEPLDPHGLGDPREIRVLELGAVVDEPVGLHLHLDEVVRGVVEHDDLDRQVVLYHGRSEEHTSELQSRFDLVCRLLLEKKKINMKNKKKR